MISLLRRCRLRLTCNWFTIGIACATRGHQWRTIRVGSLDLLACGWCGKFHGYRRLVDEATP